jgi:Domain of unknown function (DUF4260)
VTLPGALLRLEGLATAAAAVALYVHGDYSWWLFAALALAPDLSFVFYAAGPRVGALGYDIAHTEALPVALGTVGVLAAWENAVAVAGGCEGSTPRCAW